MPASRQELIGSSRARALAVIGHSTLIELEGTTALVLPAQDRIVSDAADKEALVSALVVSARFDARIADLSEGETDLFQFQFGARLSSVLWSLSLREVNVEPGPWDRDSSEWRIARSPRFDQWGSAPHTLRLAALFATRSATLGRGGAIANCAPARVSAFLTACDVCGIHVFSGDSAAERRIPEAASRGEQMSRLRPKPEPLHLPAFLRAHDFRR